MWVWALLCILAPALGWQCPYTRAELWTRIAPGMTGTAVITAPLLEHVLKQANGKCLASVNAHQLSTRIANHCTLPITQAAWESPAFCVPPASDIEDQLCAFVLCYEHMVLNLHV